MFFDYNCLSTKILLLTKCLTTNDYIIFPLFFDPIEQYDLGWVDFIGCNFYPAYIHICLIIIVLLVLISSLHLTVFGYCNHKLYSFLKTAFISVCGPERQILFPYFYYIFFFLLISNVLGMIPW